MLTSLRLGGQLAGTGVAVVSLERSRQLRVSRAVEREKRLLEDLVAGADGPRIVVAARRIARVGRDEAVRQVVLALGVRRRARPSAICFTERFKASYQVWPVSAKVSGDDDPMLIAPKRCGLVACASQIVVEGVRLANESLSRWMCWSSS